MICVMSTLHRLREDCYKKYLLRKNIRDDLEKNWSTQKQLKIARDTDELKHRMKSGIYDI